MSKMDRLREMREARYAEHAKGSPAKRSAPATKPRASAAPEPDPAPDVTTDSAASDTGSAEELCGHRNMGGRTCTRERGHTAKSHRYS